MKPAPILTLQVVAGPHGGSYVLSPELPALIGRLAGSAVCLLDEAVSRRHASAAFRSGSWFIADQGSAAGTFVNDARLPSAKPVAICTGDFVRVGPWVFRALVGYADMPPLPEPVTVRVQRGSDGPSPVGRRLDLLMDCIALLNAARDEAGVAAVALEKVLGGCGYARGAILRREEPPAPPTVIVHALRPGVPPAPDGNFHFSRSLADAAARGDTALLTLSQPPPARGQSIADLGIHSALCTPVRVGSEIEAFMYLDARGSEQSISRDAAAFCEAVARALGLALANIRRVHLEARQRALAAELAAAREAQQFILPPPTARVGFLRYCMSMKPGAVVAGDLFDAIPLPGGRVAVFLGDAVGHGAASGMLMSAAQSHLHALVLATGDPAVAVGALNRYLAQRAFDGRFLSVWLGVFSPDGHIDYVDAGHGHWLIKHAHTRVPTFLGATGIPVGIDPDHLYTPSRVALDPADRVVLFSDGIIEQRNPAGDRFGLRRLMDAITPCASADEDLAAIFTALAHFAAAAPPDDDTTAASIQLER